MVVKHHNYLWIRVPISSLQGLTIVYKLCCNSISFIQNALEIHYINVSLIPCIMCSTTKAKHKHLVEIHALKEKFFFGMSMLILLIDQSQSSSPWMACAGNNTKPRGDEILRAKKFPIDRTVIPLRISCKAFQSQLSWGLTDVPQHTQLQTKLYLIGSVMESINYVNIWVSGIFYCHAIEHFRTFHRMMQCNKYKFRMMQLLCG